MTIEYITLEDLLVLCRDDAFQVRDIGLLDGAVQRPRSSLFGRDAYPTIHEKAAVLLESLARNHQLVDGNKRMSWLATHVFYGLNGLRLDPPEDDAYDLVIAVSTGEREYTGVARQLATWVSQRSHGALGPVSA